jgi:alpha-glucosidase (family GH31 glycosyl hydrolase)
MEKMNRVISTFLLLICSLSVHGAGLEDLESATDWYHFAPGVWQTTLGNTDAELAYTSLAAEPPRIEALNQLSEKKFPFDENAIQYRITDDNSIIVRIPTLPNEKIYGFGLQFDGIQKSKKVLTLNVDHWAKGGGRTHAPAPFYISSRGYGVFFNTARFLKVYVQVGNRKDSPELPPRVDRNPVPGDEQPGPWQAVPKGDAVEAQIHGKGLNLVVFAGESLLDVVSRYNLYCGGGVLPPLWGLGFWHRVPAAFNADETRQEVQQFVDYDMPLDVIGLEPGWMSASYPCTFEWQKKRFPDPKGFTQELLQKGIRLNLWENPYISPAGRLYEKMYPLSGSHLVWLGLVPDYTLPAARKLLTDQHNEDHISIGISGYKIDEVDGYDRWLWPDHATFPSGTPAEVMRQSYGLMMQKMLYQDLFKKNNLRTYGLVRASSGAASAHPFIIYSDAYKHSEYITGISAASLCGILWTPEVRQARSSREWINRIQTVCFSPMAKLNAWSSGKKPWSYDGATEAVRDAINLRLRLLPYLYTAFAEYYFNGTPPLRAMILETDESLAAPKKTKGVLDDVVDPYAEGKVVERNDQFMFGPSILVAPFYEKFANERDVTLPAGGWYDFYTGEFVGENTTITVSGEDDRLPLFVKKGAVIPMLDDDINNTKKAYGHPLEVRIYGASSGQFDLYEDDGVTFDYQNSRYRQRRISVSVNRFGKTKVAEELFYDKAPAMFGPVSSVKVMN